MSILVQLCSRQVCDRVLSVLHSLNWYRYHNYFTDGDTELREGKGLAQGLTELEIKCLQCRCSTLEYVSLPTLNSRVDAWSYLLMVLDLIV